MQRARPLHQGPKAYICIAMKYKQLTREQRYAIYLGLQEGKSKSAIARQIGVHPSTVCREIRRNSWRRRPHSSKYAYTHERAQEESDLRRYRRPGNRAMSQCLTSRALRLLREEQWSPAQISGWLSRYEGGYISHETIYKAIRQDKAEGGDLWKNCRHKMRYRHHIRIRKPTKATNIPERVSIHDRPHEADGKRFGDWEMDFIVGKGQRSQILTLCERSTNYLIMRRVAGHNPKEVAEVVRFALLPYKRHVLTITTDNGIEFREHKRICKALGVTVYFTDAYSSWQKGAIENTNKLIRQYLPKGTDFNTVSDEHILAIQHKINKRPRMKLNFSNPKSEFFLRL